MTDKKVTKRLVKCYWCGEKHYNIDMEFEMVGKSKPVKQHYHKHCHQKYLEDKEFKRKEMEKKDVLNKTLLDIYGVKGEIPSPAWVLLEKLRNGERIFGEQQKVTKRYKEGYDYLLIEETFRYCSDTIEYWNRVKNFNGFMGAFRYALTIIIDKIYVVEQRAKEREAQKRKIEEQMKSIPDFEEFETSYKPKEKTVDITEFLDD